MRTFFDLTWYGFQVLLVMIVILIIIAVTRKFIKRKLPLALTVLLIILGGFYVIDQTRYTTFEELFSTQLHEETTVESITITVMDLSQSPPERKGTLTVTDETILKRLVEDLSEIKLREGSDPSPYKDFTIRIVTTNETGDRQFVTESLFLNIDQHHLNHYEIVSDTNHLKTIEGLVRSEETEWED
ncbi:hypothetical protein AB3N04_05145 [Alkalihalophilus sp. As8PL]|uniref:Uncharacterized protein n=1 Tax=Alkalihalophilus sp. As8PL TaxID=3237103 RepID=A0AB39BVW7_9BACI